MKREFTGKHAAAIIVTGFAIIIAVNLFMATLAVRGFGGVIVENSYVAGQEFNDWLDAAEEQEARGWSVEMTRSENGHLLIDTTSVPDGATVTAEARRPLGQPESKSLSFIEATPGNHVSLEPLDTGRWIVRLKVASPEGEAWSTEEQLP